jgi:peroxiredoxin
MASEFDKQQDAAAEEFRKLWRRGPTHTRWTGVPPQEGDPAPRIRVQEATGARVRLSAFWDDGPALLIFSRHFGCPSGLERAERLREAYPRYVDAGASVVLITMGEPARAVDFARTEEIPSAVVCDPEGRAYRAYGLLEGAPARVLYDRPELLAAREEDPDAAIDDVLESERTPVDNPWQLGGDFVVDDEGVLRLTYRHEYPDDFPDPALLHRTIEETAGD